MIIINDPSCLFRWPVSQYDDDDHDDDDDDDEEASCPSTHS